ncbi:MAG: FGGY-family carbohydrate kinase [Gemmatimonadota bacterium]|jgi:xylulokinase
MPIYLGLDCGTQSLNALAVEIEGLERRVLFEHSLPFDEAFPRYGTRHGVYREEDPLVVTSSPLMWADALDTMLGRAAEALGPDVGRVAAVSGSAQQHGSVYLRAGADARLASLDPSRPLAGQLEGAFAVERSPVWMDASTGPWCAAITEAVGGPEVLARHTGSRAFERFTGPQIRKLRETRPAAWAETDRVHLVSSYLATLLLGSHAPVDRGDGAGMNLLDLHTGDWWEPALLATAPGLRAKLPRPVPSDTVVGRLHPYWAGRHGLPRCRVVAWTGDNPSSLIGLGVVGTGTTAISLGTSDTVFTIMTEPSVDPAGTAHVFGAPTGGFMSLVCFRNGSLARERVKDRFGLDWAGFSSALRATPPGNRGALMIPWFEAEITPPVARPVPLTEGLDDEDGPAWVRACVEGQMVAMRRHSSWAAPDVVRIHATGGAARNRELLQVMADVFEAPVHVVDVRNAACLGAALRAAHADLSAVGPGDPGPPRGGAPGRKDSLRSRGGEAGWAEVLKGFVVGPREGAIEPRSGAGEVYRALSRKHAALEARALGGTPARLSTSRWPR